MRSLHVRNLTAASVAVVALLGLTGLPLAIAAEGHNHPENGPHGGQLIELGDEEYHAELMLDEKNNIVTFYILDKTALKTIPIEARELLVNLKAQKPVQFRVKANMQKGDPEGQASRYSIKSPDLVKLLHRKDAAAQLRVNISGKPYSGKIQLVHHHDHDH